MNVYKYISINYEYDTLWIFFSGGGSWRARSDRETQSLQSHETQHEEEADDVVPVANLQTETHQGWKLLSCSQCQEFGQRANLAPDWLPKNNEPIRSRVSFLTQLLTLTTTQKFPSQASAIDFLDDCEVKSQKRLLE